MGASADVPAQGKDERISVLLEEALHHIELLIRGIGILELPSQLSLQLLYTSPAALNVAITSYVEGMSSSLAHRVKHVTTLLVEDRGKPTPISMTQP